jgi:hypothetical protein
MSDKIYPDTEAGVEEFLDDTFDELFPTPPNAQAERREEATKIENESMSAPLVKVDAGSNPGAGCYAVEGFHFVKSGFYPSEYRKPSRTITEEMLLMGWKINMSTERVGIPEIDIRRNAEADLLSRLIAYLRGEREEI